MKIVDLEDFDNARDMCMYMDTLSGKGVPYEYLDEHMVAEFEDEADREKWLEDASGNTARLANVNGPAVRIPEFSSAAELRLKLAALGRQGW